MTGRFKFAARSIQGGRRYQEDMAIVWPGSMDFSGVADLPLPPDNCLVAILADGMGGHAGGAVASALACERFVAAFAHGTGGVTGRLRAALDRANDAIAAKVDERPMFSGMGSTLVGVHFGPDGVEWVSVGDSPLYLYRNGEIVLLNEDHSMAPEVDRLAEAGRITWEMARNDPRRHYLRSAVTGAEMEMIDVSKRPLALVAGDIIILASDGIHTLAMERIASEIQAIEGDGLSASRIGDRLIAAVEDARESYQDNTTVVVVRVV
jgi:PPM family protein phosphatase